MDLGNRHGDGQGRRLQGRDHVEGDEDQLPDPAERGVQEDVGRAVEQVLQ